MSKPARPKPIAPAPRLTLWVPTLLASMASLIYLALWGLMALLP